MDYLQLVGHRFGPGQKIIVDDARVAAYCHAIGVSPTSEVPLLLVASLLPALGSGIELPLPPPRATINYGLNRLEQVAEIQVGSALQATFTIVSLEKLDTALQVVRAVEVSASGRLAARAETVTRLIF